MSADCKHFVSLSLRNMQNKDQGWASNVTLVKWPLTFWAALVWTSIHFPHHSSPPPPPPYCPLSCCLTPPSYSSLTAASLCVCASCVSSSVVKNDHEVREESNIQEMFYFMVSFSTFFSFLCLCCFLFLCFFSLLLFLCFSSSAGEQTEVAPPLAEQENRQSLVEVQLQ